MEKKIAQMAKALAEKDALLRKRTAAQEAGAAEKLKVPTRGGGATKKPTTKTVKPRARKSGGESDSNDENTNEGSESSEGISDDKKDSKEDD